MDQKNKSIKFTRMKTYLLFLGLTSILIVTSCEKFINVDQPDVIEKDHEFKDKNSIRLSILGLYGLMTDLVEPMFLAGEVRADLVVANKSAGTYIKEYGNNSYSVSNPYISPKPYYTLINNTNDFIHEFESLLDKQEMDTADFIMYKSELVAIRVWTQYQIAKIFGKCKYYSKVLVPGDTSGITEFTYGNELLNKLVTDLQFSDTNNFTTDEQDITEQVVRFSDFYVNALLGELYLDLGNYEDAYDKFNEVTSRGDNVNRISTSGRFNVVSSFEINWFNDLFQNTTSSLVNNLVFAIAFDSYYNQTNELWNWTTSLNYQVAPATWYINQFREHAYKYEDYFDIRYNSVLNTTEIERTYAISKYLYDDYPFIVMRTARLELLKAYCLNFMGKNAITLVNKIRKRLDFPEIDVSDMPENDTAKTIWLEDKIVDELAYETGFEGQRWFDLMRIAKRRDDPSYLADKVAQKYTDVELKKEIRSKLMDEKNWYIPIF